MQNGSNTVRKDALSNVFVGGRVIIESAGKKPAETPGFYGLACGQVGMRRASLP